MRKIEDLSIGAEYTKLDLADILDEPSIASVREGIYYCKKSPSAIFFVDLEKKGKQERLNYNDFFDGEYFHWDSQTTQHINSPKIQEIVNGVRIPHLFIRIQPKIKSITQPFIYCGQLEYEEYEKGTSNPVHIVFNNLDYDDFTENEKLLEIYQWKPGYTGHITTTTISKQTKVSERRKIKYKKPDSTERRGLVTSRVGQGYYRQQIIDKWNGRCPVTGCSIKQILISSHIVPWSESNDDERLDPDNGILLSPNVDALFDKHLISFDDDGNLLISDKIHEDDILNLGINVNSRIQINDGMKKFLGRHRNFLYD